MVALPSRKPGSKTIFTHSPAAMDAIETRRRDAAAKDEARIRAGRADDKPKLVIGGIALGILTCLAFCTPVDDSHYFNGDHPRERIDIPVKLTTEQKANKRAVQRKLRQSAQDIAATVFGKVSGVTAHVEGARPERGALITVNDNCTSSRVVVRTNREDNTSFLSLSVGGHNDGGTRQANSDVALQGNFYDVSGVVTKNGQLNLPQLREAIDDMEVVNLRATTEPTADDAHTKGFVFNNIFPDTPGDFPTLERNERGSRSITYTDADVRRLAGLSALTNQVTNRLNSYDC